MNAYFLEDKYEKENWQLSENVYSRNLQAPSDAI